MAARKDASQPTPPNRRRLGRGLTSLMSTAVPIEAEIKPTAAPPPREGSGAGELRHVDIDQIKADPRQPRQRFDEAALEDLASSIRTAGLMQPIVLRPLPAGGFQIVVGERRWRAAQKVGLTQVPAVVRDIDDQTAAEWALIENIQREDLNPMERANAFRRLTDRANGNQLAAHLEAERAAFLEMTRTEDFAEGVSAFLAKRSARFHGY